jgi:hypothetical protein
MASSSKKRTTMAKLARENKLRERRFEKQARKDARKHAADNPQLGDDESRPAPSEDDPQPTEGMPHTTETQA